MALRKQSRKLANKVGSESGKKADSKGWKIKNSFVFIAVVLVSIIIGVFYFTQTIGLETELPSLDATDADILVGLRVEEINPITSRNSDYSDLWKNNSENNATEGDEPWENDYAYRFNTPLVLVSLDYVYISQRYLSIVNNKICFQELSILDQEIDNLQYQNLFNREDCVKQGINYFVDQSTNYAVLLYDKNEADYVDPYYYPFDQRSIDLLLRTKARMIDEYGKDVALTQPPRVEITVTTMKSSRSIWKLRLKGVDGDATKLTLALQHPPFYQAFTIFILFAMWVAIISLSFFSDDSFWEVTIGIFGLWGIQSILLPENALGYTLISDLILYLYLLLSIVILFLFIKTIYPRWKENFTLRRKSEEK